MYSDADELKVLSMTYAKFSDILNVIAGARKRNLHAYPELYEKQILDHCKKYSYSDLLGFKEEADKWRKHDNHSPFCWIPEAEKFVNEVLKLYRRAKKTSKPLHKWVDQVKTKYPQNSDGRVERDGKGDGWWHGSNWDR